MELLDVDAATARLDGVVHLDTQRAPSGLDLTVTEVARVTGAGALDFGGSEFRRAARETVSAELASPEDDYGWWELEPGSYLVRYNESLELGPGQLAQIHPLPRLVRAGASHPSHVIDGTQDPLETLLTVASGGCALKENCRISRLLVLEQS